MKKIRSMEPDGSTPTKRALLKNRRPKVSWAASTNYLLTFLLIVLNIL